MSDRLNGNIEALISQISGTVSRPGDGEFDTPTSIWNSGFHREPSVVVRPANSTDVARAITFAHEEGWEITARSGGHSLAGYGSVDGGMVIDFSSMKAAVMDPERQVARVQPGVTWGEYAARSVPLGLVTSSGDMGTVGVGGLTLGGGIGWMVRKHGLTIDSLLEAEVVTADGHVLTASPDENADLFWGIRGGGGNLGVVTSLSFRLQETGLILGGGVVYDAARAPDVLAAATEYAQSASDELTVILAVMTAPPVPFIPPEMHGKPVVAILLCYAGDLEEGERVVAPLRTPAPVADFVGPMPYPALFEITKEGGVPGLTHTVRSTFLEELTGPVIEAVLSEIATTDSPNSMAQLRILGGAMSRVPTGATAFAHRDQPLMLTLMDSWAPGEPYDGAWVKRAWESIRGFSSGVYVNFLQDEGEARIREAYNPTTYSRLAALKRRYDPDNVFSRNQNIAPASIEQDSRAA